MQVCTSLQTDNHASTLPLSFYRPDVLPAAQPTASKHWRHNKVTGTKNSELRYEQAVVDGSKSDKANERVFTAATLASTVAQSLHSSCVQSTIYWAAEPCLPVSFAPRRSCLPQTRCVSSVFAHPLRNLRDLIQRFNSALISDSFSFSDEDPDL